MAGTRLPEHSHCRFCGDPIPFGDEYCDDECRKGYADREAADKRRDMMFYVTAAVAIVALVAIRFLL